MGRRRRTIGQMLKDRWADRKSFGNTRSWLWSTYSRLLLGHNEVLGRLPTRFLPLRGHVVRVDPRAANYGKVFLRLGTHDFYVLEELLNDANSALFRYDLGDVKTVIDLGANIGLSVRLWQKRFPAARIIAVEPDTSNSRLCRLNASVVGGGDKVRVVQAAIAGKSREIVLDRSRGESAYEMREALGDTDEKIPAMTVPQLLDESGIDGEVDFMKCDIEGAERELFQDAGSWLTRVRNLLVELHPPYSVDRFIDDVRRSGRFSVEVLETAHPVYPHLLLRRDPA